jgi:hypothetical protein
VWEKETQGKKKKNRAKAAEKEQAVGAEASFRPRWTEFAHY